MLNLVLLNWIMKNVLYCSEFGEDNRLNHDHISKRKSVCLCVHTRFLILVSVAFSA